MKPKVEARTIVARKCSAFVPKQQEIAMHVTPYLNFDGRCDEALEFYKKAIGAEVDMLMRFKDNPGQCEPGATIPGDKVMHCAFRVGETLLMASDCHSKGGPAFQGFSLSLNPATEAQADKLFTALADGGKVQMPLAKTFFSPRFGVVSDRFGVSWMIVVEPKA